MSTSGIITWVFTIAFVVLVIADIIAARIHLNRQPRIDIEHIAMNETCP
jgi:hypothetical protein